MGGAAVPPDPTTAKALFVSLPVTSRRVAELEQGMKMFSPPRKGNTNGLSGFPGGTSSCITALEWLPLTAMAMEESSVCGGR
jgi:hypothetical protein